MSDEIVPRKKSYRVGDGDTSFVHESKQQPDFEIMLGRFGEAVRKVNEAFLILG